MLLKSRAKINLFLQVEGLRADGYHNVKTVYQTITLADTVCVQVSEGGIACTSEPPIEDGTTNLAYKAASLLRGDPGQGVRIHLEKEIPISAGLGGGSSNAAAVLLALNLVWNKNLSAYELGRLARTLGADVPFFLKGGAAVGFGRGDLIRAVESPFYPVVLAKPALRISTRQAYSELDLGSSNASGLEYKPDIWELVRQLIKGRLENVGSLLYNSFQSWAESKYPVIGELREAFIKSGAIGAAMSGTGPTVFAICKDEAHGAELLEATRGLWNWGRVVWAVPEPALIVVAD